MSPMSNFLNPYDRPKSTILLKPRLRSLSYGLLVVVLITTAVVTLMFVLRMGLGSAVASSFKPKIELCSVKSLLVSGSYDVVSDGMRCLEVLSPPATFKKKLI